MNRGCRRSFIDDALIDVGKVPFARLWRLDSVKNIEHELAEDRTQFKHSDTCSHFSNVFCDEQRRSTHWHRLDEPSERKV